MMGTASVVVVTVMCVSMAMGSQGPLVSSLVVPASRDPALDFPVLEARRQ